MRADDWIEWNGGKRPVAYGTLVEVRMRNGEQFADVAGPCGEWALDWTHGGDAERDIIAYRLSGALTKSEV